MANASGRPLNEADSQSRARLICAARQQFSRHGFAATTTREIARLAAVNPALIRYYFNNKAGLFQAVLRETIQPILGLIKAQPKTNQPADMAALVRQYHQIMAPHPELPLMIFRALHSPLSAEYQMVSEVFNGVIRDGIERLLAPLTQHGSLVDAQQQQALVICGLAMSVFPFLLPDLIRQALGFSANPTQLAAIADCATSLFGAMAAADNGEHHA